MEIRALAPQGFRQHLPFSSLPMARSVPAPCTSWGQGEEGDGHSPRGAQLGTQQPWHLPSIWLILIRPPSRAGGAPCLVHSLADGFQLHSAVAWVCWAHPAGMTRPSPAVVTPISATSVSLCPGPRASLAPPASHAAAAHASHPSRSVPIHALLPLFSFFSTGYKREFN